MLRTGTDRKIGNGIVGLVTINMVDDFMPSQFSAEVSFHNVAMFVLSDTVNKDYSVSLRSDSSFAVSPFLSKMGITIPNEAKVMSIAKAVTCNFSGATKDFADIGLFMLNEFASFVSYHPHSLPSLQTNIQQMMTVSKRAGDENGVNSGKSKSGYGYDNPEPSRVNGMKVTRKVQRLGVEEPTNKTPTSAPPERDDIVQTLGKPWDNLYVTDGNGVSIERAAARAAGAGVPAAGVAAETIAAGDYGLVQVWGYHSATRVRNMTGGSPAMAAGNPLAMNAAGSVFCLENFDTGSNQLLVYPCAFALGKTTKWTTAAVAVFIKAL